MGFSRQEYWSGLPCTPPRDLPNPGIESLFLVSPALAGRFCTTSTTWEAQLQGVCCAKSFQSYPTLCDPMDCSLPGFSVRGILQVRILKWVAVPSSKRSSQPRDLTRQVLYHECHLGSPSRRYGYPYKHST